jgi:hypothetical protein
VLDGCDEHVLVVRWVEIAGDAMADQIERPCGCGGHHGKTRRQRFLYGLAERLVCAGVHEHVQRCERPAQLHAPKGTGEPRAGQAALEVDPAGTVSYDDHAEIVTMEKPGQKVNPLLRRQPSDVAHHDLAAGSENTVKPWAAMSRIEGPEIHSSRPQRDAFYTVTAKVPRRAVEGASTTSARL